MSMKIYLPGSLENITYVSVFTKYNDKWVYCWHKYRKSYEHPGGHVEPGEKPLEAARRELYEETGIRDCELIPLWDYEYVWENGEGRNNGRVYLAIAKSLGELPPNEMSRVELFDDVPEPFTYKREDELSNIADVEKIMRAYQE